MAVNEAPDVRTAGKRLSCRDLQLANVAAKRTCPAILTERLDERSIQRSCVRGRLRGLPCQPGVGVERAGLDALTASPLHGATSARKQTHASLPGMHKSVYLSILVGQWQRLRRAAVG